MLSAIDTTLPQFTADVLLVVLMIVNGYVGWRTGTVRRMLSLIGLYAAFLAAYYTGNSFASLFTKGNLFANAWAFVAVVVVVVLIFELVGRTFSDRLERLVVVAFDRTAGLCIGAALGFFEAMVLFMVALAVGAAAPGPANNIPPSRDQVANAVRGSSLSGQAIRAEPAVRAVFAPFAGSDLTAHFEEGTQVAVLHF